MRARSVANASYKSRHWISTYDPSIRNECLLQRPRPRPRPIPIPYPRPPRKTENPTTVPWTPVNSRRLQRGIVLSTVYVPIFKKKSDRFSPSRPKPSTRTARSVTEPSRPPPASTITARTAFSLRWKRRKKRGHCKGFSDPATDATPFFFTRNCPDRSDVQTPCTANSMRADPRAPTAHTEGNPLSRSVSSICDNTPHAPDDHTPDRIAPRREFRAAHPSRECPREYRRTHTSTANHPRGDGHRLRDRWCIHIPTSWSRGTESCSVCL